MLSKRIHSGFFDGGGRDFGGKVGKIIAGRRSQWEKALSEVRYVFLGKSLPLTKPQFLGV